MTERILFVDDDETILRSYTRILGFEFNIDTALGGEPGLEIIKSKGPYAVIVKTRLAQSQRKGNPKFEALNPQQFTITKAEMTKIVTSNISTK